VGQEGSQRVEITRIGEGGILGWSAVVTESRAASAKAATDASLIATDGVALKGLFDVDRDLAFKIMWRVADVLSDRVSQMTHVLAQCYDSTT
jgi:CRP-like cAMP-binding protein